MKLTILGCHSASPQINTHPTSQVLEIRNHVFLIDCGEGTQVQLRKYKVRFSRIKHIFISHLHGDHYFGLVGMISTFRLLGRETELHIHAPKGIKEVITLQMKLADSWTNFPLYFHELSSKTSEMIFEDENVEVHTIPLDHRVYTNGFLFKEKPFERKLNIHKAQDAKINKAYFRKLKQGFDVENEDGELIKNDMVTSPGPKPKRYAFCSDTAYNESIVPLIKDVDAIYHESTFLEQHKDLAKPTKHSTAKEAGKIATMASVGQLILGHFSSRYDDIENFKEEASEAFQGNIILAETGKEIVI
ncbi:MAG: ribonuclease Z [Bacteroidia bacterium]|nr:ribonuclease Z [Bacteroidia bacterium]MBT8277736.1 ribonuclease Z [Bacteroidia bacterium]NND25896.1 ribonuclease Z [Flavobacteriaceae bacterium]NNK59413.1 ribonuclease Z [Flavobacteriaceae bacterium]NNL33749.1 ribonuclease Z [Flavobacteriaceae bacterium]